MRTNRLAIYILTPLTIISLLLAIVLRYCSDFTSNVFLSIFGSSLLTLIIAIINYFNERRKTCEAFWTYCHKAKRNYSKYHSEYDLEKKIDTVFLMNEFDYSALDNAYGDFAFLFNNKKLHKKIGCKIYQKTMDTRDEIAIKAFHFNEYKNAKNGNKPVMEIFIGELDDYFFVKEEFNVEHDNGSAFRQVSVRNRIVNDIEDNLLDWYYDLMYPLKRFKKKKENNNAD